MSEAGDSDCMEFVVRGVHTRKMMKKRYFFKRSVAAAALLIAGTSCYGGILSTTASVRSSNSLIVDFQVKTSGSAAKVAVTYQTANVEPLVSRFTPVSLSGSTTITIGRLRAEKTYTYTVRAIDDHGGPSGTAAGTFTTGSLPAALLRNTYTLQGRTTVPLVILPQLGPFQGFVALDLHSADAPQVVWYYSNAPSTASGTLQADGAMGIIRDVDGNFLFADAGSGTPTAADSFYRKITSDGSVLAESPADCSVTAAASPAPKSWIWGQGNDLHEQLLPGADGVAGTVLHLAKIVKDPFFDAGLAPQGTRLQMGTGIRRWDPSAGTDEAVWDPFNFLDPLTERTEAANSDPGINSSSHASMLCAGMSLPIEEWSHSNSLQVAPTGVVLMSVRHLDTVIAISSQFDGIAWRIGRFKSDFAFPDPSDRFYHEHYVRMMDNGNLLLFDNGNGRPAAEGGSYSRALELALNWDSMTANKVWEYRHPVDSGAYKYSSAVGAAERLENGNTLVLFGTDVDPVTLSAKNPQTFTLVEADADPQAGAVAVLDMQVPIEPIIYRPLAVKNLFGEVPGK